MFKAGDQIRCINRDDIEGQFTFGNIYIVSRDVREGNRNVSVQRDDSGSTTNGWSLDCFELVEPAVPVIEPQPSVTIYTVIYREHLGNEVKVVTHNAERSATDLRDRVNRSQSHTLLAMKKIKLTY